MRQEGIPPEALSGFIRPDITITASGTRVVKWQADTGLLKELRENEKQVASELQTAISLRNLPLSVALAFVNPAHLSGLVDDELSRINFAVATDLSRC